MVRHDKFWYGWRDSNSHVRKETTVFETVASTHSATPARKNFLAHRDSPFTGKLLEVFFKI